MFNRRPARIATYSGRSWATSFTAAQTVSKDRDCIQVWRPLFTPLQGDHSTPECRTRIGPGPRGRSEEQRLNSSHLVISYAVFCLKKKKRTLSFLTVSRQ